MKNISLIQKFIESDYITVLQYSCHENEKVNELAKDICKKFAYAFPNLYFSKKVFQTLTESITTIFNNLKGKFSVLENKLVVKYYD